MKKKIKIISFVTLLLFLLSVGLSELPNQAQNLDGFENEYILNTSDGVTTLIFGIRSGPSDIDPQVAWPESFAVIDQVVEGLFAYNLSDPKMGLIPNLALDYGTWSGSNYTIDLKPNIYFHDGTLFDAYAVKFTFERLNYFMENDMAYAAQFYRYYDVHASEVRNIINFVDVIDENTITFVLNQKVGIFESLLCLEASYIVSPSSTPSTERIDISTGTLVGTGPFVYDNYEPDIEVNFHAFENYWKGTPNITNLKISIIEDTLARNNALLSGDVDMIIDPLDSMLDIYRIDPNITLESTQGFSINYIAMNDYWINTTFRKAISYAINYSYIIDVLMDSEAVRMKSPFPENMMYANWSYNVADFNITKAREIMQSMGFGVGFTTDAQWQSATFASFKYSYNVGNSFKEDLMVLLWSCLDLIGIDVIDDGITWSEYFNRLFGGNELDKNLLQLYWFGWGSYYNDPHSILNNFFTNRSSNEISIPFSDYMIQTWVEEALIETNSTLRNNLYNKIQKRLVEELYPWAFGYIPLEYVAYNQEISGFQWNSMQKVSFFEVIGIYRDIPPPPPPTDYPIYIDGGSAGIGAQNWTWAANQNWCSGSGTFNDPYVIQDLIIDCNGIGNGILIENSNAYFRIENCKIYNASGTPINDDAGIKLLNTINGLLINNTCSINFGDGIILSNCSKIAIFNNNITGNNHGITIESCEDISILNNTLNSNRYGIWVMDTPWGISVNLNIVANEVHNNMDFGVFLWKTINSEVSKNNISESKYGLVLLSSNNSIASSNLIRECSSDAIFVNDNNYLNLTENVMLSSGLTIYGSYSELSTYSIHTSNLVNGKPFYYYIDRNDLDNSDFINPGQIFLINCSDSILSNINISSSSAGLTLNYCTNMSISDCNFSDNIDGIILQFSNGNTIFRNLLDNNYNSGVSLSDSDNNLIYWNNLFNNDANLTPNIYISEGSPGPVPNYSGIGVCLQDNNNNNTIFENVIDSNNIGILLFNSSYTSISNNTIKENYEYGVYLRGSQTEISKSNLIFSNYFESNLIENAYDNVNNTNWNIGSIGNYWDDYPGVDADDDGIGDTPYSISGSASSIDNYPIWDDGPTIDDVEPSIVITYYDEYALFGTGAFFIEAYITDNIQLELPITIEFYYPNGTLINEYDMILNISDTYFYYWLVDSLPVLDGYYFIISAYDTSNNLAQASESFNIVLEAPISNYWILSPFTIDELGYGHGDYTWAQAVNEEWCSGSGTLNDPYVIKNIIINGQGSDFCLSIQFSEEYFIVENCTFYNTYNLNYFGGLVLINSSNGKLLNNNCSNNYFAGIYLWNSHNFLISGNFISTSSSYGIVIDYLSSNNSVYNNTLIGNNINAFDDGGINFWDNGVIGNYWDDYSGVDANDDGIGDSPYIINGGAETMDNFPIWDDGPGVPTYTYWVLSPFVIDDSGYGDYTWEEASNQEWCSGSGTWTDPYVLENIIINAQGIGNCIKIMFSNAYFIIKNCSFSNSGTLLDNAGIYLYSVNNGKIIDTDCSDNYNGIEMYGSNNNTLSRNTINNNLYHGIYLGESSNNTLSENLMNFCGILLWGSLVESASQNIDDTNLVNNKPVYYFVNKIGLGSPNFTNAGQIILVNCSNSIISGLNLSNTTIGIDLKYSNSNTISGNTLNNNYYGIGLVYCDYNTIQGNFANNNTYGITLMFSNENMVFENTAANNINFGIATDRCNNNIISRNNVNDNSYGIVLVFTNNTASTNNIIRGNNMYGAWIFGDTLSTQNYFFENHFIMNNIHAFDEGNLNFWDNGTIGNYWDDYSGVDANDDGIGDNPYYMNGSAGSVDNYPIWDDGPAVDDVEPLIVINYYDEYALFGTGAIFIEAYITDNIQLDLPITIEFYYPNGTLINSYDMILNITDSSNTFFYYWLVDSLPVLNDYYFIINAYDISNNLGLASESFNIVIEAPTPEYWILSPFVIDEEGYGNFTWAEVVNEQWCSGSGTFVDPYVIQDLIIDCNGVRSGIVIENSDVYFQIENCTVFNAIEGDRFNIEAAIVLLNTTNGSLVNNICSFNQGDGIYLSHCSNITIYHNRVINNEENGISIARCEEISILNNTLISNKAGIRVIELPLTPFMDWGISVNISIVENEMYNNTNFGILLYYTINNYISKNNINKSNSGIVSFYSNNSIATNNQIRDCTSNAIFINYNNYLNLTENLVISGGITIYGSYSELSTYSIDTSNLVNGKIFYYYIDRNDLDNSDFINPGQIMLVGCSDSSLSNINISSCSAGLTLIYCTNIRIFDCNFSDNIDGIVLQFSDNNSIFRNSFDNNYNSGVSLSESNNNLIYWNNISNSNADLTPNIYPGEGSPPRPTGSSFFGIGVNLQDTNSNNTIFENIINANNIGIYLFNTSYSNIRNNLIVDNYEYGIYLEDDWLDNSKSNLIYSNYFESNLIENAYDGCIDTYWDNDTIGNYWDDYIGFDYNDDGIGDTPYIIPGEVGGQDNFPIWDDGPGAPDFDPPVTTISLEGTIGNDDWYISQVLVTFTSTDDISGINYTEYSYDGINWINYTNTFSLLNEGITTLYYRSIDNEGNIENTLIELVKIDKSYGETTIELIGAKIFGSWHEVDTLIILTATDTYSGISHIEYSFDGIHWTIYETPFNVPTSGIVSLYYRSVDFAGNIELQNSITIKVLYPSFIIDNYGGSDYTWYEAVNEGLCTGVGTLNNPYIIENMVIDAQNLGSGIEIRNSNAHFIIRNCTIFNSSMGSYPDWNAGIKLVNTNNGIITNNNCSNNSYAGIKLYMNSNNNLIVGNIADNNMEGIYIQDCGINKILVNNVSYNFRGIVALYSNNINISGNIALYNGYGIQLGETMNSYVLDNIANHNYECGIVVGDYSFISGNIANFNYVGIRMYLGEHNTIINNTASYNIYTGILILFHSYDNIITENIVYNNEQFGIRIWISENTLVYNNDVRGSGISNAVDDGTNNNWDNGIIGNYWNDYSGVDLNDDGIGDIPYYIFGTAGSADDYPIWDDGQDDFNPPITSLVYDGILGNDNWYISNILITLIATDDASGVAYTEYSFNNVTWEIYYDFFNILAEGIINLYYRSVDNTGRIENSKLVTFKIDKTNPLSTIILEGTEGLNNWFTSNVTISFEVVETLSGLSYTEYSFDGVNWNLYSTPLSISGQGITEFYYKSFDLAGNEEITKLNLIKVDKTPPTTNISLLGTIGNDDWYVSNVQITFDSTDNYSGVFETLYSLDGINWNLYTGPFDILTEGEITIQYYSIDNVGFYEDILTESFKIDKTPPNTTINLSGTLGSNNWYISDVLVSLFAIDSLSGLNYIEYSLDGINWNTFSTPFIVDLEGITEIDYKSVDVAGNSEISKVEVVNIDTSLPDTEISLNQEPYIYNWYEPEVLVSLIATDYISDIANSEYSYDGINWNTYLDPFIPNSGKITIYYRSIDNAGNQESSKTISINIIYYELRIKDNYPGMLWVDAVNEGWASGSGTWSDPYLIENIVVKTGHGGRSIHISNSDVYFIIQNCTFYSPYASSASCGIYLNYVRNSKIIDNMVIDTTQGMRLTYSDNNTVSGNLLKDNYNGGLRLDYSNFNTIMDNIVRNNLFNGFYLTGCYYNNISGNTFESNRRSSGIFLPHISSQSDGIVLENSDYNIIEDNVLFDNNNGIHLLNSNYNHLSKNSIYGNLGNGIKFEVTCLDNTISGNLLTNNRESGIILYDSSNNYIVNNNILMSDLNEQPWDYSGIKLVQSSSNQISNNYLSGFEFHTGYGIRVEGTNSFNVFTNNTISNYQSGIIIEDVDNCIINDNIFINNHDSSIDIYTGNYITISGNIFIRSGEVLFLTYMQYSLISDNIFYDSEYASMLLQACNYTLISYNHIYNNGGDGIRLESDNNYNVITNNKITACSIGLYMEDSSSYNIISNNNISHNHEAGIYFTDCNDNLISDNLIRDNLRGIVIYNAQYTIIKENQIENNQEYGIYSYSNSNITIEYNFLYYNRVGILFFNSINEGNLIRNNTLIGESLPSYYPNEGIRLVRTSYLSMIGNIIKNYADNIYLSIDCRYNILQNNSLTNGGINFNPFQPIEFYSSNIIDKSNLVNNKPIYYYFNQNNLQSVNFTNAGQIILAYCSNSVISNLNISHTSTGIKLIYCNHITLFNNTVKHTTSGGLELRFSHNNSIIENIFSDNAISGIFLDSSNYNNISMNFMNYNMRGLMLSNSDYNFIFKNIANHNYKTTGQVMENSGNGVILWRSCYNILVENIARDNPNNGVFIGGYPYHGRSSYNLIRGNDFSSNGLSGIYVKGDHNNITHNYFSKNGGGVKLISDSTNNLVYYNIFIGNTQFNAIDNAINNFWDNGSTGNYWDDYTGIDEDNDGIGDTPYYIPGLANSLDNYPIWKIIEEFFPPSDFLEMIIEILVNLDVPESSQHYIDIAILFLTQAKEKFESGMIYEAYDKLKECVGLLMEAEELGANTQESIDYIILLTRHTIEFAMEKTINIVGEDNKFILRAINDYDTALLMIELEEYDEVVKYFKNSLRNIMKAGTKLIAESFVSDLYDRLTEIQELMSASIPDQALSDLEQAEHMLLIAIDQANNSLLGSSFYKLIEVVVNLLDAETNGVSTSNIVESLMSNIDDVTYLKIVEAELLLLGESNRHLDKAWVYYNKAQGLWNDGKLQSAINYFAKAIGKVKDALR